MSDFTNILRLFTAAINVNLIPLSKRTTLDKVNNYFSEVLKRQSVVVDKGASKSKKGRSTPEHQKDQSANFVENTAINPAINIIENSNSKNGDSIELLQINQKPDQTAITTTTCSDANAKTPAIKIVDKSKIVDSLKKSVVMLDAPSKYYVVKINKREKKYGFNIGKHESTCYIDTLVEDTEAAKSLKLGDKILTINDFKTTDMSLVELKEILNDACIDILELKIIRN